MKTNSNLKTLKTLSISVILLAFVAIGFSSCLKNNNTVVAASALNVINAADTAAAQDFYLNNTKVNTAPLAFTQSTGYLAVSGTLLAQFVNTGTQKVNNSFNISFQPGLYYTLFYTDDKAVVGAQNDRTAPQGVNVRVRFVNMSPALNANVDFAVTGGTVLAAAVPYETISSYSETNPVVGFTAKLSSASSILLTVPPSSFQPGNIYTVYITGATLATISAHVVMEN
jgi:hypothetical protein